MYVIPRVVNLLFGNHIRKLANPRSVASIPSASWSSFGAVPPRARLERSEPLISALQTSRIVPVLWVFRVPSRNVGKTLSPTLRPSGTSTKRIRLV